MSEIIKRSYVAEFRADETKQGYVRGKPIVFDTPTDIGGLFQETIVKGAISEDVLKDVRFFWNHNIGEKALARTLIPLEKNGGMKLHIKDGAVEMEAHLNLERSDAKDCYLAIEDGVVNAMSFMMGVAEERWEDLDTDYPKRFITKIDPLIEVSAVNFPAYKETSIGVRSIESAETDASVLERVRSQRNKTNLEETREASELELEKLKAKYIYNL